MALEPPTVKEVYTSTLNNIKANLPESDPFTPNNIISIMTAAYSGASAGNYTNVVNDSDRHFPTTSSGTDLDEWGATYGVTRGSARKAVGRVGLTGIDGSAIPLDTVITSQSGNEYVTTESIIFNSVTANSIAIESKLTGSDKNILAGTNMAFSTTPAGINQLVIVDADGIAGGAGIQDDESYRNAILYNIQFPARGGAKSDYLIWAREALYTVTRGWVRSKEDNGAIADGVANFYFMMDNTYSNGLPQGSDLTIVEDYITSDNVKPVTAQVNVLAPTLQDVDITVAIVPNTVEVQDAVTASLTSFFQRVGEIGETVYLSQISEAISLANGEQYHTLTVPAGNVVVAEGSIPVLGTITFS